MFLKVSKACSCDLNENQTEAEGGKKGKVSLCDLPLLPVISTSSLMKSVLRWVDSRPPPSEEESLQKTHCTAPDGCFGWYQAESPTLESRVCHLQKPCPAGAMLCLPAFQGRQNCRDIESPNDNHITSQHQE